MENEKNGDDFLPKNYEVPVTGGGYMKIKDGENKIRIMESPILGYEYWNTEKKPIRSKEPFAVTPTDIQIGLDGKPGKIKHFWAMIIWNYADEEIQILEIIQTSIQSTIRNLAKDDDWGHPKNYDIKITRKGDKLTTEYIVTAVPPKPMSKDILDAYEAKKPIVLEALYEGGNPFEHSGSGDNKSDLPF